MSQFTEKAITGVASFLAESVKGFFKFLADVISKNLWILILLFAVNYAIDHKINLGFLKKVTTQESTRLKTEEGEVANAVIYMDDRIIVIQKAGEKPKEYTGVRSAKLTKFKEGEIAISVKNKGFGLEPGLTVTAGDSLRLGLDVKAAYWKRWGLLAGVTVPVYDRRFDKVRGHLGLSYDIPSKWFSSTSIWTGIDSNTDPRFGLRTRFGGGL